MFYCVLPGYQSLQIVEFIERNFKNKNKEKKIEKEI